jgi:nidogen-like
MSGGSIMKNGMRSRKIVLCCYALLVGLTLVFGAVSVRAAITDVGPLPNTLPPDDDGSSAEVAIGFPVNFFGQTYTTLFVNNNGNVTFGAPLSEFTPFGLANTRIPIIAPFFGDVDTRGGGTVSFGQVTGGVRGFVVNWINVNYYNTEAEAHVDKRNSFQLILTEASSIPPDDPVEGDFNIHFNYDNIEWETGDASGGIWLVDSFLNEGRLASKS